MEIERSSWICRSTDLGICAITPGSAALMESMAATVLAPGWRWMKSAMEGSPFDQLAVFTDSTLSCTSATSCSRTTLPLASVATMSGLKSAARVSCLLARMVSVWRLPSSVPTGVLAFASFTALAMSSSVRLRAASASGRACTRTAKRFWPATLICATPESVESVGEMRFSRIGVQLRERHRGRGERHEDDRELARVHLAVGRRRRHLHGEVARGAEERRLHVHRRVVDIAVLAELERDVRAALGGRGADDVQAGDRGELLLEQRGDRRGHRLGAGAREAPPSPGWWACRTRQRGDGDAAVGEDAGDDRGRRQQHVMTGRRMNASETFMAARPSSRLLAPGLAVLARLVAGRLFGRFGPAAIGFRDHAARAHVLRALDHDARARR